MIGRVTSQANLQVMVL